MTNRPGTGYQSPNVELIFTSEQIYENFCKAIKKSTGLQGEALEQSLNDCNRATYRLLFGTEEKQELNSMEQVYLNWHRELMTTVIANSKHKH